MKHDYLKKKYFPKCEYQWFIKYEEILKNV